MAPHARDPLTGALPRARFHADLGALLGAPSARSAAIVVFDLDHLKHFNLHNGHIAGDGILERVPLLVAPGLRAGDSLYRIRGAAFAVLMQASLTEAAALAEDLRLRIEASLTPPQPVHCGDPHCLGPSLPVTASFGVLRPGDHSTVDEVIRAADELVWSAKRAGRNRVFCGAP